MAQKINVTTPVHFRVCEGLHGSYRVAIEIGGQDEKLPDVLEDSLMSIHPREGVTFEQAEEAARMLRRYFATFHFQFPIDQARL